MIDEVTFYFAEIKRNGLGSINNTLLATVSQNVSIDIFFKVTFTYNYSHLNSY